MLEQAQLLLKLHLCLNCDKEKCDVSLSVSVTVDPFRVRNQHCHHAARRSPDHRELPTEAVQSVNLDAGLQEMVVPARRVCQTHTQLNCVENHVNHDLTES